jgi:DUF1009 family protein
LSRLIETFQREGVSRAIMAGQVKHKQIFSSIRPDWKLAKLLLSLGTRNTDSLLGAVAQTLAEEGITLENSTSFLEPLLPGPACLRSAGPHRRKKRTSNMDAPWPATWRSMISADRRGRRVSLCCHRSRWRAPDVAIGRAGEIMRSLAGEASTLGRGLTVVKIAKPNQDMRFDVPVVGVKTIEVMRQAGATCLALDAGKCLLLDGNAVIRRRRCGRCHDRSGLAGRDRSCDDRACTNQGAP